LAEWAVGQVVSLDDAVEQEVAGDAHVWRQARRIVADLAGLALEQVWGAAGALPFDERDRIWRIIAVLAEDANPSPAYEARWGGTNMDPANLALNTVRPEAIDAAIHFAFWSAQHRAHSPGGLADVLGQEPDVAALLERHLDPAQDASLAVRAAIGRWLTPLARTDASWVTAHRSALLPSAPEHRTLRDALWDAFTQWSLPHPKALAVLEPEYRAAIDRLGSRDLEPEPASRAGERPEDRLAEHLVTLYWWGAIPLDIQGNLFAYFFAHADVRRRAHALKHIGFSLFHAEGAVNPELVARLQRLWDWRVPTLRKALSTGTGNTGDGDDANAHEGQVVTAADAQRELAQFGWWFASGVFDSVWALERLEEALQACGNVELGHAVAERLVELSDQEPARAAACLLKVDFTGRGEPWSVRSWLEHLPAILRPALVADDPATVRIAREVVHRVVAAGYTEHRALL
jgi:hypothetical protein